MNAEKRIPGVTQCDVNGCSHTSVVSLGSEPRLLCLEHFSEALAENHDRLRRALEVGGEK